MQLEPAGARADCRRPPSLRRLHYGLHKPITGGVLPSSLRSLLITRGAELEPSRLPPSLRLLHFDEDVVLACGALPAWLRMRDRDGMPQLDAPPPKLRTLQLAYLCQPFSVSALPASLTSITLQDCYFPQDDALPASLRRLELRGSAVTHRLTAASLKGCPQLQTLDLRWAEFECDSRRLPAAVADVAAAAQRLPG